MLMCAPFHENNNALSRLDLLFYSIFGINSNFIHIIVDLAGLLKAKMSLSTLLFQPIVLSLLT